ncbi:MAG: hypothetical protein ACK4GT_19510 [Pararhodobacter sp.]
MFFKPVVRSFALVPLIGALALFPAAAQENRAKEGWDMLRNSLSEAGLRVASEGSMETETGLEVRGVSIRPAHGRGVLRLPTLGVEPREGEGFAFIPSAGAQLELPVTGTVEIDLDGAVMFDRQADGLRLAPDFDRIEARFQGPSDDGGSEQMSVRIGLEAFSGVIELDEGAQSRLTGDLQFAMMDYAQNWLDATNGETNAGQFETGEIEELSVQFSIDALNALTDGPVSLASMFAQGFALQAEYYAAASRSSSAQTIEGMTFRLDSSGGPSDSVLTLLDGRLEARGTATDFEVSGNIGEGEGQFSAERMAAGFGLPLVMTEDMQDFSLTMTLSGVQASEQSWMLLGAQTFANETGDLTLEMAGEGRWLVDPVQADETDAPLDLASVRLDRLSLRLGQALFEGAGRFDADREAAGLEQAMAMGQGAFTFTLRGGEALLERLGREGVLPADQAFLARMMLGGLARQVGEDHLESEVTIAPGGQVLVNGMPLPF